MTCFGRLLEMFCRAVNKKTGKVCGQPAYRRVDGVALCQKHYLQWAHGKTIKTKSSGRIRKS